MKEQRDEAARALAAQERGLKRLVDAYEIGAIEIDDLKTRSDKVRARIERLRGTSSSMPSDGFARRLRCVRSSHRLGDFTARVRTGPINELSWTERRQIIRTLVTKIDIGESAATIVYCLPSTERASLRRPPRSDGGGGEGGSKGDPGSELSIAFTTSSVRDNLPA